MTFPREAFLAPWRLSANGNETCYVDTHDGRTRYTVRPDPRGVRVVVGGKHERHDVVFVGRTVEQAKVWLWPEHMKTPMDAEDLNIRCDYAGAASEVPPDEV